MDNLLSPSRPLVPGDGYSLTSPVDANSTPIPADQAVADSDPDCRANAMHSGVSHFGSAQPQSVQPDEVRL
jgi:hypothetical protein